MTHLIVRMISTVSSYYLFNLNSLIMSVAYCRHSVKNIREMSYVFHGARLRNEVSSA